VLPYRAHAKDAPESFVVEIHLRGPLPVMVRTARRGAVAEPAAQIKWLLRKIPYGIFNKKALPNKPLPSTMNGADSIWLGTFEKTTCEVNYDRFRIERDDDCR
jgi:hypothetical protein